jgi:5-methyltetrahydrofolate--homocysteine methyltransferase
MKKVLQHPLEKILENRIAIIDGAMGTTIRTYGMTEADIRGERFKDATKSLLNNGDLFSLTKPEMIGDIHRRFLEAGADIIETNTFGATTITQSEFFVDDPRERGGRKDPAFYQKVVDDSFLGSLVWDINEQSARQCREWADRVGNATARQRFVAGAIGPLTVSLSSSPDADDPGFRVVSFDQVKAAYAQQVRALIAGGADLLLVETIFDSLNAKAALVAIREVFDVLERGEACEAVVGGPQLLSGSRSDVSVPRGALGEGGRCDFLLSQRRVTESAFGNGLRSWAARHGPLSGRVCTGRFDQHRRRLLRKHA